MSDMKRILRACNPVFGWCLLVSCSPGHEQASVTVRPITESVYASGIIKSEDQYQAYAAVSGIVQQVYVEEGDIVEIGDPVLRIAGDAALRSRESAALEHRFAVENERSEALKELKLQIEMARIKMDNDALLLQRQKNIWSRVWRI